VDLLLARAAILCILLLCLHSFFDYPLRTSALTAIFAFCCGLLVAPPTDSERDEDVDAARRYEQTRARAAAHVPTLQQGQAEPAQTSAPGGRRWGKEIDWPEAWRTPASERPSSKGSKNEND
jgi:hypothetical protein